MTFPVDTHCHLHFDHYDDDRDEVIERSKQELEFIVEAGADRESNQTVNRMAEAHSGFIMPALGLHPTYTDSFSELDKIKAQIRENDPVAVGEIGLDHYHIKNREMRRKQEKVFRELLGLAEELNKPVVVHSRKAERKAFEILKEYALPGVMMHCFNGKPELAEECVEAGFKIGVTTQVLYNSRVQKIVEQIDLEDMLLETDSPFLYQGERNEPVNVKESTEKIADIKSASVEDVIEATTGNADSLFRNGR